METTRIGYYLTQTTGPGLNGRLTRYVSPVKIKVRVTSYGMADRHHELDDRIVSRKVSLSDMYFVPTCIAAVVRGRTGTSQ